MHCARPRGVEISIYGFFFIYKSKAICGGVLSRRVAVQAETCSCPFSHKIHLCDTVVFDYIQFPSFTHTTGMTHFIGNPAVLHSHLILQNPVPRRKTTLEMRVFRTEAGLF